MTTFGVVFLLVMKNNGSIKDKIFEIRRKKGISQEKMAQMLGISLNSFRKLERGGTILVNDRLWEIAKALEVSLEELMLKDDFSSGMSLADKERQEYLAQIKELQTEVSILKQHISLLTDKYDGYVKKAK